ncbi:MAG: anti-sigma factor family protein [Steroidobacteraceae bacterium]
MTFSDEILSAYADGELDAATRAAVEAALASDPQLAQRSAAHRALRARLEQAFAPVLAEPVPERLLASARGAPARQRPSNVIELQRRPRARWSWPQWGAMAASLVIGALLGPLLLRSPTGNTPVDTRDGQMLAHGMLERALSEQLASTQPAAAPVQVGVSFRARSGAYCRTFVMHDESQLAGLACRERSAWRVETLARTDPGPSGAGLRPAGSALPAAVAGTLDALIVGEPLNAAAEAAARARGWNR